MSPRYLPIEKNNHKERVIQIAAGYSHTLLMLENRELQWFGTCGHLSSGVTKPSQVKLSEHIPELFPESTGAVTLNSPQQVDFAVVKITSSWSRSLSLTNILIADLRQVNA
jgi:alpha-tubulin suppressor-like RCC1 family protein